MPDTLVSKYLLEYCTHCYKEGSVSSKHVYILASTPMKMTMHRFISTLIQCNVRLTATTTNILIIMERIMIILIMIVMIMTTITVTTIIEIKIMTKIITISLVTVNKHITNSKTSSYPKPL